MDGSISVVKDDLTLDRTGIDYRLPRSKRHVVVKREHLVKQATGGTTYAPSQTITFDIPASERGFVGQQHYFSMKVKLDNATDKIGGSVKNLIRSIKISNINGEVLEQYDSVGLIEKVIRIAHLSKTYQNNMLAPEGVFDSYAIDTKVGDYLRLAAVNVTQMITFANDGTTPTLETDANATDLTGHRRSSVYKVSDFQTVMDGLDWTADHGKLLVFQLHSSGILMNKKHLPLAYLGGLRIELILETGAIALVTGTNYTVNFPRLHYVLADYSDKVKAALSEAHRAGKLHIYYDTWDNRVVSSTASTLNVELNKPVLMLKNIFTTFRLTANQAATYDSFLLDGATTFADAKAPKYMYIHNDIRYPSNQVDSRQVAYMEFLKNTGQLGDVDQEVVSFKDYINDQFVICQDFEMVPDADAFTASSTKGNKGIVFEYSKNDALAHRIDFLSLYTRVVTLLADGTVRVEE